MTLEAPHVPSPAPARFPGGSVACVRRGADGQGGPRGPVQLHVDEASPEERVWVGGSKTPKLSRGLRGCAHTRLGVRNTTLGGRREQRRGGRVRALRGGAGRADPLPAERPAGAPPAVLLRRAGVPRDHRGRLAEGDAGVRGGVRGGQVRADRVQRDGHEARPEDLAGEAGLMQWRRRAADKRQAAGVGWGGGGARARR